MKGSGETIYSMEKEKKNVILIIKLGVDNSSYKGEYVDGKKQGKGKYTWPDGSYFEGDWNDNMISGYVYFDNYNRENIFGLMGGLIKVNG